MCKSHANTDFRSRITISSINELPPEILSVILRQVTDDVIQDATVNTYIYTLKKIRQQSPLRVDEEWNKLLNKAWLSDIKAIKQRAEFAYETASEEYETIAIDWFGNQKLFCQICKDDRTSKGGG